MFMFNRDLMAGPGDVVDPVAWQRTYTDLLPKSWQCWCRYIISDGALDGSSITEVMRETSAAEMMLRLYEIRNANLGNLSPTRLLPPIATAMPFCVYEICKLRIQWSCSLELSAVHLVPASQARLTVIKGGYHIEAQSPGARFWCFQCSSRTVGRCATTDGQLRSFAQTWFKPEYFFEAKSSQICGLDSACRIRVADARIPPI